MLNTKIRKIIFLLLGMFCVKIDFFSQTVITFEVPDIQKVYYAGQKTITVELDSLGRIIKVSKDTNYQEYEYTPEFKGVYYDIDKDEKSEISIGKLLLQSLSPLQFTRYGTSYTFTAGSLFISISGGFIDQYYLYRENGDTVESSYCEFYDYLEDEYLNMYPSYLNGYFYYKVSKKDSKKMKNSDMEINILNASILMSNGLYFAVPFAFSDSDIVSSAESYQASSSLKEKSVSYYAENLGSKTGLPWASANGYGIGDEIIMKVPVHQNMGLKFFNGFQSEEKKHLYKANSRAKRIKIEAQELHSTMEVILKDTPDEQLIDLNDLYLDDVFSTLKITILEIYPGEKYKDLCIQAIIPVYLSNANF